MLRFSLSGKILCCASGCERGVDAVLLVMGRPESGSLTVESALPVAPELPEGWRVVGPGGSLRVAALFCPEHQKEAATMARDYGVQR